MLISDLIFYQRNARKNDKAVPAVAESIREFGFKGAIVLNRTTEGGTPEHPIIVNGHTRVKALKKLGWTELPDESIRYVDDLSEDEVKALRLADNKTAEIATWNKSLLQREVKSIKSLDMSKFNFDFKSKNLSYGAERLKTDRAYNLDLINAPDCNRQGFPVLKGCMHKPKELLGFNYAKSTTDEQKKGKACHFFIDDYQFERVWVNPARYLDVLRGFDCIFTPDFSLYLDMPLPMIAWNHYRSQALGLYWQRQGLKVIPTLSWAAPASYAFCFAGIPKHATVAVSTVGVKNSKDSLAIWRDGMSEAMNKLKPRRVLLYGGSVGFDFGRCEVVEYANSVTERMANGR